MDLRNMTVGELKKMVGGDPKYKFNFARCNRCGKTMYAPMPPSNLMHEWGFMAFTILMTFYIFHRGWFVVKQGEFGGEFVCPDCHKEGDDLKDAIVKNPHPRENLQAYLDYVEQLREAYSFHDDKPMNL